MRNIPLKQAKTMIVPKVSWRKAPKPEKADVIYTRLIFGLNQDRHHNSNKSGRICVHKLKKYFIATEP